MDDFVGQVVEKVLGGERSSSATPLARPNYQREKAKSRLTVRELAPAQQTRVTEQSERSTAFTPVSDPYAQVRRATLRSVEPGDNSPVASRHSAAEAGCKVSHPFSVKGRLITKLDRRVSEMLGLRFIEGGAAGVVSSRSSKLAYLLATDHMIRSAASLDYAMDWNETGGFLLRFSGPEELVSRSLHEFAENIKQRFQPGVVVTVSQPSAFLQRYLKIGGRFPVGILEEIHLADAAFLINDYYKEHKDSTVQFRAWGDAVIAVGNLDEIIPALERFKAGPEGTAEVMGSEW